MEIFNFFDQLIEKKASDLHLISNFYPTIRINQDIFQLKSLNLLSDKDVEKLIFSLLSEEQKENFLVNKEMDFGYEYNTYRFRCNVYYTKDKPAISVRLIDNHIKTLDELNLPMIFHDFTLYKQGLVLITGPTGEGKSTTLASIVNEINVKYSKHIITIEDPIEYVYPPAKSIISQRELHRDTHSWNIALKSALREDPDIVLVGEMRDYESIQQVLTIAETGHLVFSTLHTGITPEAIDRIVDVFPAHQQNQVRSQLSSVLRAVIAQRLVPNIDNTYRIPAIEILMNTPAVAAIIREGRTHMLDNAIETGEAEKMMLFEKHLSNLYQQGMITRDTALTYSLRPNTIKKLVK
ncbi:PilT/PilU family type 4a pilus ATPase [Candidatus Roizmanbacteria bacterium]|jgi:twitching motility protein PilT|nr:PilT/PilU family type 4a pilus ATPase [Candidatus Roizmanbacteria bacterium]